MAKAKISEWSATAGNNTEIDGVPLGEGVMTPSQVNNALREIMSQVAELFGGTSGDAWPISAGGTGATSAAGARAALGIVDTSLSTATETTSGIMRIATAAELTAGTLDNVALTPKKATEWAPASATMDTVADELLIRDATDNKIKRATFPTISSGFTLATPVASTSGTAIDFTSIPSTARMIAVMFNGVSLSGTASLRVQIGDSGGVETTGYVGTVGSRTADTNLSAGFDIDFATAATAANGTLLLTCMDTTNNIWTAFGIFAADSTTQSPRFLSGRKPLSATLDRVRITSSNGTDTFDAGSVNILYQ